MPFTVAHAVVAPALSKLSGGRLAVTALAIGAMSPDFAYVAFLDTQRDFAHRLPGLLVFCLPASIAVLVVWHGLVKRPLAGLLPHRWGHLGAALCRPLPAATWRSGAATVTAVLVGAVSHVAWDSFTHPDGRAVLAFDVLREPVPVVGHRLHVWLQYGFGVAGVAALAVMIVVWARRQPRVEVARRPVGRRVGGVAAIFVVTLAGAVANVARVGAGAERFAGKEVLVAGVLGAMAGVAVAVTVYGVSQAGRGGPELRPEAS